MNFSFFIYLFLLRFCHNAASLEVPCELVKSRHWSWTIDDFILTCFLDDVTTIGTDDTSISSPKDNTVKGLLLEDNQNIKFLPVKVYEKFPSLVGLSAFDCRIKTISKTNFEKLYNLKEIHLHGNQIERISSNTFEDLSSLEQVFLGKF